MITMTDTTATTHADTNAALTTNDVPYFKHGELDLLVKFVHTLIITPTLTKEYLDADTTHLCWPVFDHKYLTFDYGSIQFIYDSLIRKPMPLQHSFNLLRSKLSMQEIDRPFVDERNPSQSISKFSILQACHMFDQVARDYVGLAYRFYEMYPHTLFTSKEFDVEDESGTHAGIEINNRIEDVQDMRDYERGYKPQPDLVLIEQDHWNALWENVGSVLDLTMQLRHGFDKIQTFLKSRYQYCSKTLWSGDDDDDDGHDGQEDLASRHRRWECRFLEARYAKHDLEREPDPVPMPVLERSSAAAVTTTRISNHEVIFNDLTHFMHLVVLTPHLSKTLLGTDAGELLWPVFEKTKREYIVKDIASLYRTTVPALCPVEHSFKLLRSILIGGFTHPLVCKPCDLSMEGIQLTRQTLRKTSSMVEYMAEVFEGAYRQLIYEGQEEEEDEDRDRSRAADLQCLTLEISYWQAYWKRDANHQKRRHRIMNAIELFETLFMLLATSPSELESE